MIKFRQKDFSIQEGRYTGSKRTPRKGGYLGSAVTTGLAGAGFGALTGLANEGSGRDIGTCAIIGGLVGAGFGAFCRWMANIADNSEFNLGRSHNCNSYLLIQAIEDTFNPRNQGDDWENSEVTVQERDERGRIITRTRRNVSDRRKNIEPENVLYEVDGNPNNSVLSLLYQGNVLVIYVNKPNIRELRTLDYILDGYCRSYKEADYLAYQTKDKKSYVIELDVIENTEDTLMEEIINNGFKPNIITKSRLGINGR